MNKLRVIAVKIVNSRVRGHCRQLYSCVQLERYFALLVRLANAKGPFGHKRAPPLANLREGVTFGEGGRGAARARLAEVLEVAPE